MRNKKFISGVCIFLAILMAMSLLISFFGSIGALGVSQSEIDALEKQKDAISEKKNEVSGQIADLQAQQASVLDQKAALDEKNELARQEIELINEQIEIYDKLIQEKSDELVEAKAQEQYQQERFRTRMRAMEENGTMGYIAFVFQATSFSDLITRIDNISEVMESDKSLEDQYIAARENVETVKAEYEEVQEGQLQKKDELQQRKEELEQQIADAEAVIESLSDDIDTYKAQYSENEKAEQELEAEIQEKTEQFNKEQEQLKNQGQTVVSGTGNFMNPLSGTRYVTSGFGWRIHPIFGDERFHSGVDITANSGEPIYAADDGTVQTAVYSASYGNYVVINHGNGYTTLYAHMSSMAVSAGQSVSKGQVIGYVGSTGWATGPHLHYEVAYNGSRVDPMPYLAGYIKSY
ncbi:MAG: murein hydrolase activator EnvC [Oscillospiraceae bacterium]